MGDHTDPDYSLLGDEHVARYRETDGEVGYDWNGAPTLLLTTTGRKSGQRRTTPVIFGRDGDRYVIIASMGGMPMDPAWLGNLQADPRATIQVKAQVLEVTAEVAGPDEKPRLWTMMNGVWPRFDVYQSRTDRDLAVVVLSPIA